MGIVAGVDSSTQSCTVELREANGGLLLGTGSAPHPNTTPPVSEQTVEAWWDAFTTAWGRALGSAQCAPENIRGISVAAQCHGMVLLDKSGNVLRPVKLWNDTTSAPQAEALEEEFGRDNWAKTVGSVPTAAFTITKLAWLAANEPDLLQQVATVLLPHDYLTWRLTGKFVTDRSEASGTGYYAAHENRWLPELLERFVDSSRDWHSMLPEVLGPEDGAGQANTVDAQKLGLRSDTVVGAGAGDQHAGALGMGLKPGEVLYSLGTSGVVMTPCAEPVHDLTGWVDGVADATGGYLPLVCTLNSAKVTDFVAQLLGIDYDELARLALAADRFDERPIFAAYLEGERSPSLPCASGTLTGIRTTTTREAIALAAIEGVLLGLVRGHRKLTQQGISANGRVFVAGGGARSLAYRQILADILQVPIHVRDVPEATARGACIQAAALVQEAPLGDVRDKWEPEIINTTEPRFAEYDRIFQQYIQLARFSGDTPWEDS